MFELLVRYHSVPAPPILARRLLEAWTALGLPPLQRFSRSGPGIPISAGLLDDSLAFSPAREDVAVLLRSSRRRDAEAVEMFFTNPSWHYTQPANYVAVRLSIAPTATAARPYSPADVLELAALLISAGSPVDCTGDTESVYYDPLVKRAHADARRSSSPQLLWLTHFNGPAALACGGLSGLSRMGFVAVPLPNLDGCIVLTAPACPSDPQESIRLIQRQSERLHHSGGA